ncbi:MAG: sensor domain-containing diguanylate cyclase, partial [Lachnospiraceae bacterium]|nr:sensor domain-containing diguanylate cyclase [Lachnospiraceae bacterium]
ATSVIYANIAHALSQDYTDLFYVNMETDEFIEYHTDEELGMLVEVRRSTNFFDRCKIEVKPNVHPEEHKQFVTAMDRDFLNDALSKSKIFTMTYRRIKNGRTFYVEMKVSRMKDDNRYIVIAVSDIDELVKKRLAEEKLQEERIVYARLYAISGNYISIYVVDPETSDYHEFSATDAFKRQIKVASTGTDFFTKSREISESLTYPADYKRFLSVFTKENIMAEIEKEGIFSFKYRLLIDGNTVHVQIKAAMVEEAEGPRLIVGLNNIDAQVRQAEQMEMRLEKAETRVNIDTLTGVKNKHAYFKFETRLDLEIEEDRVSPFAITMLDINDLKKINDTAGHQAGDEYIRSACKIICETFNHSPVFRIGGDEFVVISQGSDYDHIDELIEIMDTHNARALESNGVVIACGMSKFEKDNCVADIFKRADDNMYEDKNRLKS